MFIPIYIVNFSLFQLCITLRTLLFDCHSLPHNVSSFMVYYPNLLRHFIFHFHFIYLFIYSFYTFDFISWLLIDKSFLCFTFHYTYSFERLLLLDLVRRSDRFKMFIPLYYSHQHWWGWSRNVTFAVKYINFAVKYINLPS